MNGSFFTVSVALYHPLKLLILTVFISVAERSEHNLANEVVCFVFFMGLLGPQCLKIAVPVLLTMWLLHPSHEGA